MEREEGELTDEDLEDISDSSTLSAMQNLAGKLPLGREPLQELSLTAISDDSDDNEYILNKRSIENYSTCRKHRSRREQRKYSGNKRVRKISERRVVRRRTGSLQKDFSSISSSSDDSDDYRKDEYILRQLSEAVRINQSQKLPNCSLRSRLKGMIMPDSQASKTNSEDDHDLDTLRDLALQSKAKKETEDETLITDKDLIELRLNALHSAVLKKHQNRRKNREEQLKKQSDNNVENADPTVKENIENKEITPTEIEKVDNNNIINNTDDDKAKNIDEDEAILRAMLLSSISNNNNKTSVKNISAKNSEKLSSKEGDAILHNMLISSIYNDAKSTENNQDNFNDKNKQIPTKEAINSKNVDEDEDILRAMLLANVSKKIADQKNAKQPNNNSNINKVRNIVPAGGGALPNDAKYTLKLPSAPVNRFIISLNDDSDSDCDQTITEKTKPEKNTKTEDIFNKSLSLFLQQARAKCEAERKSDISHLPKSQQLEYRRLKRKLQQLTNNKLNKPEAKEPKLNMNKNTLNNERRNNKDDRLRVKGKYEELGPLMTKVSDARVARDKAQAEVKKLINDLRIARADLNTKHQNFTVLMQQLVTEKSIIDKRLNLELENKNNSPIICTSTPTKSIVEEPLTAMPVCDLSAITETSQIQPIIPTEEDRVDKEETVVQQVEDMDIEESTEDEKKECSILKYSSPLDHIQINREYDPLVILCPYDLNGVCRDSDCAFRHCNAVSD